jgi:hypothetical protein
MTAHFVGKSFEATGVARPCASAASARLFNFLVHCGTPCGTPLKNAEPCAEPLAEPPCRCQSGQEIR